MAGILCSMGSNTGITGWLVTSNWYVCYNMMVGSWLHPKLAIMTV